MLLYDSRGTFIASVEGGRLHSPAGANDGHYLPGEGVFIDPRGQYLGEVVHGNRLMYNVGSPYRSVGFAVPGVYGDAGRFGNPGNAGAVELPDGYDDIPPERLTS
jgi:hypothetical protein